ncbi:MAG: thermonuclease family protein [Pseudomonadaceae bacterium]|jgi:endonuclease YncB( thermonuclease family)|nr:thermonuclease family protein [Pseudomonadaceae bacterium]
MSTAPLLKKASLAGAFFVSVFWGGLAQAFCPLPSGLPTVKVQHVVDGDTLKLSDGRSVRLIGINTPELAHHGRTTEPFAEAARRRLQALVKQSGGQVSLQVGREARDHYGRTLAHGYDSSGQNLEASLLAEGLGYLVAVAPNTALVVCQQAAEQLARTARLGLWAKPAVQTPAQITQGGFALVTGRVLDVQRNRGGVWLELEGGLVLQVAVKSQAQFDWPSLLALTGRQIQARGWVIDRAKRGSLKASQARWMLPLTHAAMLEVLP